MKKIFNVMAIAITIAFISCNEDDDMPKTLEGKNNVSIEFDAGFAGDDLVLGRTYTNENNEKLTITAFDYIVSNFRLITKEGKEFVYPKNDSYFIISEGGAKKKKSVQLILKNVPAGEYTKIKFGIGVDQKRYKEGKLAQEDFWTKAEGYNLTWSWQAGYKFVVQEGEFTSAVQKDKKQFKLHIASRGTTVDLYKEVELSMKDVVKVSTDISPQIHIAVDASKMLTGENKVKLSETNTIMGGPKASLIANNNKEMFTVHHVHNGVGKH